MLSDALTRRLFWAVEGLLLASALTASVLLTGPSANGSRSA